VQTMNTALNTHILTIEASGHYIHGDPVPRVRITAHGDGGIEHWLDTVRAALVAAGYAMDTAKRVRLVEDGDE